MRTFLIFLLLLFLGLGLWLWFGREPETAEPVVFENTPVAADPRIVPEVPPAPEPVPVKREVKSVRYEVPFTSQAPTGDWSQSAFQDGCEEASTLMVWMAREGKEFTPLEAKAKLLDMAAFQTKQIGHGVDTDAADTNEYLFQQYFNIVNARVEYDFTLEELQLALQDGLVIVPTNGRALQNPNFTLPGPLQHMLVITGYDMATKEFITNDPGTRRGEGYRYLEEVLYDAIREYPTGKHLPIKTERKAMIIIPFTNQS